MELSKRIKAISEGVENNKYKYITNANNPDSIGAEYEYNSMANTEVIDILKELEMYFTQAEQDGRAVQGNWNANVDITNQELDMLKSNADMCRKMLDNMMKEY